MSMFATNVAHSLELIGFADLKNLERYYLYLQRYF